MWPINIYIYIYIYNKSIINPNKKNHKNPIIFTQFLPLIWGALCPSQITPSHSHKDNFYAANHSIYTPISITSNLDQLVSLTQPMKRIYSELLFIIMWLSNTSLFLFFFFTTFSKWKFLKGKDLTSLCYLNFNQVIINKKFLNQGTNNCLTLFSLNISAWCLLTIILVVLLM